MQGSVLEICKWVLQCFAYANVLGDLVSGKSIYSFAIHCSVCDDQLYFQLHTCPPPAVSCPFFRENRISIRQTHHAAIARKKICARNTQTLKPSKANQKLLQSTRVSSRPVSRAQSFPSQAPFWVRMPPASLTFRCHHCRPKTTWRPCKTGSQWFRVLHHPHTFSERAWNLLPSAVSGEMTPILRFSKANSCG